MPPLPLSVATQHQAVGSHCFLGAGHARGDPHCRGAAGCTTTQGCTTCCHAAGVAPWSSGWARPQLLESCFVCSWQMGNAALSTGYSLHIEFSIKQNVTVKNRSIGEKPPFKQASYSKPHIAFQVLLWGCFVRGLMESYTDHFAADKLKFPLTE